MLFQLKQYQRHNKWTVGEFQSDAMGCQSPIVLGEGKHRGNNEKP